MIKRLMLLLAALMLLCTTAMADSPTVWEYSAVTVPSNNTVFRAGMAIFQLIPDSARAAMLQQEMSEASSPVRAYGEKSLKKFAAALPGVDLDKFQLAEITGVSMEGDGDQLDVNICFLTPFQQGQTLLGVLSTTTVDFPVIPRVEEDGTLTFPLTGTMVRYLIRTEDGVLAVFIQ